MNRIGYLLLASVLIAGPSMAAQPPACEQQLDEDLMTVMSPLWSPDPAKLSKLRADAQSSIRDCELTGIGEPEFYPFPVPRLDFASLAGDVSLTRHIVASRDPKQGYYHTRSKLGETPLHFAARFGTPQVIEVFLKNGFDPDVRDVLGETPLMAAADSINGTTANMDVLIAHGANINARNHNGLTALAAAVMNSNIAAVKDLLDHHADLDLGSESKTTIFEMARRSGNQQIVNMLQAAEKRS